MNEPRSARHGDFFFDPVTEVGQRARGLYMGARYIRRNGHQSVVDILRFSQMDAAVIDIKDAEGRIHHDTEIVELEPNETGWLGDVRALVQLLHDNDMYAIARVTCFADRVTPTRYPDRAIQSARRRMRGRMWVSWGTGGTWLDPYHPSNHAMLVNLAIEVEALGFDEIQLDYVRFPVDDGVPFAYFPAHTQETQNEVLLRFLLAVDRAISIPIGVDVFGLAAFHSGDSSRLGQNLATWVPYVEVYTPMIYINAMRAWSLNDPNRTYNLVRTGMSRLRSRVGPTPILRPFLQAFAQGAGTEYNPRFITDNIRAAHDSRSDGFLFWHPGQSYSMVRRGMERLAAPYHDFEIPAEEIAARAGPASRAEE